MVQKWDFGYWRAEREIGRGWEREGADGSKRGCNGRRSQRKKGTNDIRSSTKKGQSEMNAAFITRECWAVEGECSRVPPDVLLPAGPKASVTAGDSSTSAAAPGTPAASCFTRFSRQPSPRLVFLDGSCSSSTYYTVIELKFPWLEPKWKCNGTLTFCLEFYPFSLSNRWVFPLVSDH